ncbi:hypothetical protein N7540_004130 [Penicillium herquei]|nr:hypothetical protein N7540_004130 [Penicillium herquei]
MRVLYYTFICLFGTTLAMPVQSQGAQALQERQSESVNTNVGSGAGGSALGKLGNGLMNTIGKLKTELTDEG